MSHKIKDECISCGACEGECPKYVIDLEKCFDCGVCVNSCPVGTIE
jgi:NAD-dependent dihydropyrimidine dehydrogenase PreA subunit